MAAAAVTVGFETIERQEMVDLDPRDLEVAICFCKDVVIATDLADQMAFLELGRFLSLEILEKVRDKFRMAGVLV